MSEIKASYLTPYEMMTVGLGRLDYMALSDHELETVGNIAHDLQTYHSSYSQWQGFVDGALDGYAAIAPDAIAGRVIKHSGIFRKVFGSESEIAPESAMFSDMIVDVAKEYMRFDARYSAEEHHKLALKYGFIVETAQQILNERPVIGLPGAPWDLPARNYDGNTRNDYFGQMYPQIKTVGQSLSVTAEPHCFPSGTLVLMANGSRIPIDQVQVGDRVATFNPLAESGRSGLLGGVVTRLFENVTTEWIRLSTGLVVTPGHHFLDSGGKFQSIDSILKGDGLIVSEGGGIQAVSGIRIKYSAQTAGIFEQSNLQMHEFAGSAVSRPYAVKGWATYNFEVSGFHTYIAGGVRVHNQSVFIATGKDVDVGARFVGTDGYHRQILDDGSILNLDTGHVTAGGAFAERKYISVRDVPGHISSAEQYEKANGGAFHRFQVDGTGPATHLASGSTANAGTWFGPGNGNTYVVAPNGSIINASTGRVTAHAPTSSSGGTSSPATPSSPAMQPHTQVSGNGPSVRTSTGHQTSAGTTYNPGNGYTYRQNADGTSTNLQTGRTYGKAKPVILDLDGDGIEIQELTNSDNFAHLSSGGAQHRTAWAGSGDGVLVRDAGNDGIINQSNEFDFTSWAPSASSDMQALLAVFDTNHDGKLSALDEDWSLFKVLVTNADGTQTLRTMAELGITSINLISNNQEVSLSDGSKIIGTTTYSRTDGSTGSAADTALAYDAAGYIVAKTVIRNADGSTTIENRATRSDGSLAFKTVSTTSANGNSRTTSFDNDGDGVNDRIQSWVRIVNGDGSITETLQEHDGGGTILLRKETTVTSADKKTITVSRDVDGSGVNDRIETRVTNADGSQTITVTNLNANGSTHDRVTTSTGADGLSKSTQVELTGNGVTNASRTSATTVAGDGARTEVVTDYAGNGTTAAHRVSKTTTTTSADRSNKAIDTDLDGNGSVDLSSTNTIVHNADGSDTTTQSAYNGNGSLRSRTITQLSSDGNNKTVQVDADGNGVVDLTTTSVTTNGSGGSTTRTVTDKFGNNTTAKYATETWSADGRTRSVSIDADGDGNADSTQTVAVVGANSVDTINKYSANGATLVSKTVTTTSSNGLSRTSQSDVNGDGNFDSTVSQVTVVNGDGSSTVTKITANGTGATQIGKTVTTTSANGLVTSVQKYLNAEASPFETVTDTRVLNGDGSITRTIVTLEGSSQVQAGKVTTSISADRLTEVIKTYVGTNSLPETVVSRVTALDGSKVETASNYSPNGATLIGKTTTVVSSDGLSRTITQDMNGDSSNDQTLLSVKTLNTDGTTTVTDTVYQGVGTAAANKVGQTTTSTSGNGLTVNTQTDSNGDGTLDTRASSVTVLNTDGSRTTTLTSFNSAGTVQTGKLVTTVSDDGLAKSSSTFLGNHTTADKVTSDVTVLNSDGSTVQTVTTTSGSGAVTSRSVTTKSGNGLSINIATDRDGNGVDDHVVSATTGGNGIKSVVTSEYTATGVLASRSTTTVSADGLSRSTATDADGDGDTDKTVTDTVVLNANGSKTQTQSTFDSAGALKSKTIVTVSADGLSKTSTWDGTGAGSTTRSQTDIRVVNSDGSTTRTVSNYNANGSLHDKSIVVTSADGLTTTSTEDINGNGVVDQTTLSVENSDGSTIISRMDGSVQSASGRSFGSAKGAYQTIDAAGLSSTTRYDASGDGLAESQTTDVTVLNTDGTKIRTITHSTLTGGSASSSNPSYTVTNREKSVVTSSANGLAQTTQWDLTGSGTLTDSETDVTVLNADGSNTRTVSTFTGATLKSRYAETTSGDGLTKTTQWDAAGAGSFTETSTAVKAHNADGSVTETVSNFNNAGGLISKFVSTESLDGLSTSVQKDLTGSGSFTETETTTRALGADGSITITKSTTLTGGVLRDRTVTQTSSDGITVSITRDSNGDGIVDQTEVITNAVDGTTTTVATEWSATGAKVGQLTSIRSPDGRVQTSLRDLDGDGINDRSTNRTSVYNADGSSTETLQIYKISDRQPNGTVTVISPVLLQTVTTVVSADGRTRTSSVDVDGNGTVDETSTTSFKINGAQVTNVTDNISARSLAPSPGEMVWSSTVATSNKTVAAATSTTVRGDDNGRTVQADYDGNGTYEHTAIWKTRIDGSQSATITEVNGSGAVVARGTQTISSDSRTSTLSVDANNDGYFERQESLVVRVDGSKVKTVTELNTNGTLKYSVVNTVSPNGNAVSYAFTGGSGNDGFTGGDGNDTLDGGTGNDTLVGGKGDDSYTVDSASDIVTEAANEGTDTIKSSVAWTLAAAIENLTLVGTGAINGTGNSLNNTLVGNGAANTLNGGAGNDYLDGGAGADTMIGGDGDDTYVVDQTGDIVTESGTGTDLVRSSISYALGANVENLTLTGSSATNGTGNGLANSIVGNSANNILDGGAGADTMNGGAGDDTYVVDSASDIVIENGGGNDTIQTTLTYSLASLAAVENLTLLGSANINGTGNALSNLLRGNSGNNALSGGDGDDTLIGGAGADSFAGGAGTDTVSYETATSYVWVHTGWAAAQAGDAAGDTFTGIEIIKGSAFNDEIVANENGIVIYAGSGNDKLTAAGIGSQLFGGDGNDSHYGSTGVDLIDGGSGDDNAFGYEGNDTILLGDGNDWAYGGIGDDIINGGIGNDDLYGDEGNDLLIGGAGADDFSGGTGTDTVSYESAASGIRVHTGWSGAGTGDATGDTFTGIEIVKGTAFNDEITANETNVYLYGGAGNDTLTAIGNGSTLSGDEGDDTLNGSASADTLNGGSGSDTMAGGEGSDVYLVDSSGDSVVELSNQGTDLIQASVSYVLGANTENLTLVGSGAINGTGNALANQIVGNSAANVLDGGAGVDLLSGGDGDDTYIVDAAGDVVNEVGTGNDTVLSMVAWSLAAHASVENLTLTGSSSIDGTGNSLNNILTGNAANNGLHGGGGNDRLDGGLGSDGLYGGMGDDTYVISDYSDWIVEDADAGIDTVLAATHFELGSNLENLTLTGNGDNSGTGNSVSNTLIGNSANNYLDGKAGNDTMIGGAGDDTYVVDSAGDQVTENSNEGTDLVQSSISYTLGANIERLALTGTANVNATGNSLSNILFGNAGANILDGGLGGDALYGGAGDDTYVINDYEDWMAEDADAGIDTVLASTHFELGANFENLTLTGSGAHSGTGNGLANLLMGNGANNYLDGRAGNDRLNAGAGDDLMSGGSGDDTFVFVGASGFDTIYDFQVHGGTSNGDFLELHGESATNFATLLASMTESGGNTFIHLDSGDMVKLSGVSMSQLTADDFRFL